MAVLCNIFRKKKRVRNLDNFKTPNLISKIKNDCCYRILFSMHVRIDERYVAGKF